MKKVEENKVKEEFLKTVRELYTPRERRIICFSDLKGQDKRSFKQKEVF